MYLSQVRSNIRYVSLRTIDHFQGKHVSYDNKQLLDEVFVICGIINVEVRVISQAEGEADNSYRDSAWLITLTETLIILHITKTESDNCFIIHCKRRE